MTHYAVLRHNFDAQQNPDRLGPGFDDEPFWLSLGSGGKAPTDLVGQVIWLISWEGFMKTHHVVRGWFKVGHLGKRAGVVAQHFVSGHEGAIYARGVGPLDMREWFHAFAEENRPFREGEPTALGDNLADILTLVRAAHGPVPTE